MHGKGSSPAIAGAMTLLLSLRTPLDHAEKEYENDVRLNLELGHRPEGTLKARPIDGLTVGRPAAAHVAPIDGPTNRTAGERTGEPSPEMQTGRTPFPAKRHSIDSINPARESLCPSFAAQRLSGYSIGFAVPRLQRFGFVDRRH